MHIGMNLACEKGANAIVSLLKQLVKSPTHENDCILRGAFREVDLIDNHAMNAIVDVFHSKKCDLLVRQRIASIVCEIKLLQNDGFYKKIAEIAAHILRAKSFVNQQFGAENYLAWLAKRTKSLVDAKAGRIQIDDGLLIEIVRRPSVAKLGFSETEIKYLIELCLETVRDNNLRSVSEYLSAGLLTASDLAASAGTYPHRDDLLFNWVPNICRLPGRDLHFSLCCLWSKEDSATRLFDVSAVPVK